MRIRRFRVLAPLGAAFLVVGLTMMSSAQAVALAQSARSRDSGSVGVLSRPAHLTVKKIPEPLLIFVSGIVGFLLFKGPH